VTLPWFGSFSTAALEYTIKGLRRCGFQGDDISTINQQSLDQAVSVKVEHEEYNGRYYARVAFVNKPGGTVKLNTPLSGTELRVFAAQLKQRLGGSTQRPPDTGRPKPSEQLRKALNSPGAPPYHDDEIPF
jgi:hypothetical protein